MVVRRPGTWTERWRVRGASDAAAHGTTVCGTKTMDPTHAVDARPCGSVRTCVSSLSSSKDIHTSCVGGPTTGTHVRFGRNRSGARRWPGNGRETSWHACAFLASTCPGGGTTMGTPCSCHDQVQSSRVFSSCDPRRRLVWIRSFVAVDGTVGWHFLCVCFVAFPSWQCDVRLFHGSSSCGTAWYASSPPRIVPCFAFVISVIGVRLGASICALACLLPSTPPAPRGEMRYARSPLLSFSPCGCGWMEGCQGMVLIHLLVF